jgi:hypothetical protein
MVHCNIIERFPGGSSASSAGPAEAIEPSVSEKAEIPRSTARSAKLSICVNRRAEHAALISSLHTVPAPDRQPEGVDKRTQPYRSVAFQTT